MKVNQPEIPINPCDTCRFKEIAKYEALAKCCSKCPGDHPHINATLDIPSNQLIINCPYCGNIHIHDEVGVYTCDAFLYTIQPKKVIAWIHSAYISICCPFCCYRSTYDSIPPSPYFPICCEKGLIEIVDTVENIYHSTKRIATNRLASI